MASKKQHIIAPKKSDAKKKAAENNTSKSVKAKRTNIKKRNEFGDADSY